MRYYFCSGRRHQVGPNLNRLTVEVNGRTWIYHSSKGSNHEAAFMAQRAALALARRDGIVNPVIHNANPLVTHQMNKVWQARQPVTKRQRSLCRAAAVGMRPTFI